MNLAMLAGMLGAGSMTEKLNAVEGEWKAMLAQLDRIEANQRVILAAIRQGAHIPDAALVPLPRSGPNGAQKRS